MKEFIRDSLVEAQAALESLLSQPATLDGIAAGADLLVTALKSGKRIFSCGNGGSMCDAMHFAEELSGRYRLDRKGLPAAAISDPGHLTCVGNDYGYEHVFARYLESHSVSGDCLLAISTSGKSKNILIAAQTARRIGMKTIALTGRPDSKLHPLVDIDICTPAGAYADRVQELHIKVIHILIELIERSLFPVNYGQ
jgi:D-sedoheptulose 7-phosphate isomerase